MLFNSCDSSHLHHSRETFEPHPLNWFSTQLSPLGRSAPTAQHAAFQVRANNVDICPADGSHGLRQSQEGDRYFQNMLHDACNKNDSSWRIHGHQQNTPAEGYQVSPTYNERPIHPHHPSLAISHLQWNRNVPAGYTNYTGDNIVDYLYSSNAYHQTIPPRQLPDSSRSEVGEEMTVFSNHDHNQAPMQQLPLLSHRHYLQTISGRDGPKCNEANPSSFLKYNSSSLRHQHPITDNPVQTTSGSYHSPQTQIKVESSFASSLSMKTEESSKLDKKNFGSSSEDVRVPSIKSPSIDAHQRKSTKSESVTAGKTRTREKYRTVYSERQRLELERMYVSAAYIPTIDRKTEIARCVGLTDRQVKIWFQNRRAKERKDRRKMESAQNNQH